MGMVYLRARFYEPEMNCFSQKAVVRGSIAQAGSLNRYTHVAKAVNRADETGKYSLLSKREIWSLGGENTNAIKNRRIMIRLPDR